MLERVPVPEKQISKMGNEFRTLRPYKGVDQVQAVFDDAVLHVGEHDRIVADGNLIAEANLYLTAPIKLSMLGWDHDSDEAIHSTRDVIRRLETGLEASGLSREEFNIVMYTVAASTPYLKILDTIRAVNHTGFKALIGSITVAESGKDSRPRPLLAPSGGCTIELVAYLATDRDLDRVERPMEVTGKGTWLARATFDIVTDLAEIGFTPTPLTPELKDHLELPRGTLRYITVEDTLQPNSSAGDMTVYVDNEALNAIGSNSGGSGARAFMVQLALDVVTAIVTEASRQLAAEPDTDLGTIQGSLCHRLIRQASRTSAGRVNESQEAAMFMAIREDPLRVISEFEGNEDDIKKFVLSSIKGADG